MKSFSKTLTQLQNIFATSFTNIIVESLLLTMSRLSCSAATEGKKVLSSQTYQQYYMVTIL